MVLLEPVPAALEGEGGAPPWTRRQLVTEPTQSIKRPTTVTRTQTDNLESQVNQMCMFLSCWRELEKLWTPQQPSCTPTRYLLKVTSWSEISSGLRKGLHRCHSAQTSQSALRNGYILTKRLLLSRVKCLTQYFVFYCQGLKHVKSVSPFPSHSLHLGSSCLTL